ncbi:MAG: hypothetical protein RRC34_04920 [Lentisphaeria bacterium]|nr:hypothetical protein [Lentisphaeria bacterium]
MSARWRDLIDLLVVVVSEAVVVIIIEPGGGTKRKRKKIDYDNDNEKRQKDGSQPITSADVVISAGDFHVHRENMKPFTWLVGGPQFKLVSELSPEEFAMRFRESIDKPRHIPTAGHTGATPILGKLISQGRFRLQERCLYRNSGLPYFNGCVRPSGGGSEITGSFTVHPIVIPVMVLFLFWACLFAVVGCFAAASSLIEGNWHAVWGLLAAMAALAGLVAAAIFTTVISKKKQEMYLEFFERTFGAKLIERKE